MLKYLLPFFLTLSFAIPSQAQVRNMGDRRDRELWYFRQLDEKLGEEGNPLAEVNADRKLADGLLVCLNFYEGKTLESIYNYQSREIAELVSKGVTQRYLTGYYSAVTVYGIKAFCPQFFDKL